MFPFHSSALEPLICIMYASSEFLIQRSSISLDPGSHGEREVVSPSPANPAHVKRDKKHGGSNPCTEAKAFQILAHTHRRQWAWLRHSRGTRPHIPAPMLQSHCLDLRALQKELRFKAYEMVGMEILQLVSPPPLLVHVHHKKCTFS